MNYSRGTPGGAHSNMDYMGQIHNSNGWTESDAYEPTVQYAQVGSKKKKKINPLLHVQFLTLPVKVVRKQRRTAISPATQLTCAIHFFVRSKKYLSISRKQGGEIKYWQLYAKITTK